MPKGSAEVFAIATPVSNPAWLVMNGNNKLQVQALMFKTFPKFWLLMLEKRGIGSMDVAVVTEDNGTKPTVPELDPRLGPLLPAGVKLGMPVTVRDSITLGLSDVTSYTASAVPPDTERVPVLAGTKVPFPVLSVVTIELARFE